MESAPGSLLQTIRSSDFEDGLDLNRDVSGQGSHADRAAGADPGLWAEDFSKELAATVDDARMVRKIWRAVDHAQDFDHAFDPVQVPEFTSQSGENGEPGLARGELAGLKIQVRADTTGNACPITVDGSMAGHEGEIAHHHQRLVNADGFRGRWEDQTKIAKPGFWIHPSIMPGQDHDDEAKPS